MHDALFFFFNDTATTEIYTLSLHDALPILPVLAHPGDLPGRDLQRGEQRGGAVPDVVGGALLGVAGLHRQGLLGADRKSTRLNSSHANISYAVFCLKKKKSNAFRLRVATTI